MRGVFHLGGCQPEPGERMGRASKRIEHLSKVHSFVREAVSTFGIDLKKLPDTIFDDV